MKTEIEHSFPVSTLHNCFIIVSYDFSAVGLFASICSQIVHSRISECEQASQGCMVAEVGLWIASFATCTLTEEDKKYNDRLINKDVDLQDVIYMDNGVDVYTSYATS